ncbi:MAG: putative phosphoribosyl transferase [Gammaproteobacteria bacterium]|nr:putative phosphoribosyl transferase [Gammaproteobacteria bacterium]
MHFIDRADAGRKLARLLLKYRGQDGVVLALPRGGVPVAAEVARALAMPLDLVTARKIGHPGNPEYAIAAVTESGELAVNPDEVDELDRGWFDRAVAAQREEAQRRHERYIGARAPIPLAGRIAIVVDDGIATGLTVRAAIMQTRKRGPGKLVLAVPVAPRDTAESLGRIVDEFVACDVPAMFMGAVGAYYQDFSQTGDEEVAALLAGIHGAGKP